MFFHCVLYVQLSFPHFSIASFFTEYYRERISIKTVAWSCSDLSGCDKEKMKRIVIEIRTLLLHFYSGLVPTEISKAAFWVVAGVTHTTFRIRLVHCSLHYCLPHRTEIVLGSYVFSKMENKIISIICFPREKNGRAHFHVGVKRKCGCHGWAAGVYGEGVTHACCFCYLLEVACFGGLLCFPSLRLTSHPRLRVVYRLIKICSRWKIFRKTEKYLFSIFLIIT